MAGSSSMTPFEQPVNGFDAYQQPPVTYSNPIFPRAGGGMQFNQIADEFDFNATPFQQTYQPAQAYISPTNTTPITPHNLMMTTPITPAYSNITEPSPYDTSMDLAMDMTKSSLWNEGLPTPSSFLQAQSRDPSISEHSPMIAGPPAQFFGDAPMLGQNLDFPEADFSLFGGESSTAFSNPAAATATLFPGGPEAFASLDNDPMFDQAWNDNDFIDYDMIN